MWPRLLWSGRPPASLLTPGGSFVWGRVQGIAEEFPPEALGNVRGRCILEGYDSIAIFPLLGENGPIGSLHLADFAPEKFAGTVDILEAVCRQCGPLLVRHQDEERERALLRAVEAALLPRQLPQIPGLELAVAVTSATEMAQVGGDFYDAFARLRRGPCLRGGLLRPRYRGGGHGGSSPLRDHQPRSHLSRSG